MTFANLERALLVPRICNIEWHLVALNCFCPGVERDDREKQRYKGPAFELRTRGAFERRDESKKPQLQKLPCL